MQQTHCERCGSEIVRHTFKGKAPKYCKSCREMIQEEWRKKKSQGTFSRLADHSIQQS